jgi:hypothetical protein
VLLLIECDRSAFVRTSEKLTSSEFSEDTNPDLPMGSKRFIDRKSLVRRNPWEYRSRSTDIWSEERSRRDMTTLIKKRSTISVSNTILTDRHIKPNREIYKVSRPGHGGKHLVLEKSSARTTYAIANNDVALFVPAKAKNINKVWYFINPEPNVNAVIKKPNGYLTAEHTPLREAI